MEGSTTSFFIVCSLFVNDVLNRLRCFVKKVLARITRTKTFISHTKISIVSVGTGQSTNYIAWKLPKSNVHARLVLTRKQMPPVQVWTTEKILTKNYDYWLEKNCDAETCTSDVGKNQESGVVNRTSTMRQTTCDWIKKIVNQATWKVIKHLSTTLVAKYPASFICFYYVQ